MRPSAAVTSLCDELLIYSVISGWRRTEKQGHVGIFISDGIISRIIGSTSTICPESIFFSHYNRHYGFSSAVLGNAKQGISGKSSLYCIENVNFNFYNIFYSGVFLSTGTYADVYIG